MKLDLGSLESTKSFIESFKRKNLPLHILICNAGIAFAQQGLCVAYMQHVAVSRGWHSHIMLCTSMFVHGQNKSEVNSKYRSRSTVKPLYLFEVLGQGQSKF